MMTDLNNGKENNAANAETVMAFSIAIVVMGLPTIVSGKKIRTGR